MSIARRTGLICMMLLLSSVQFGSSSASATPPGSITLVSTNALGTKGNHGSTGASVSGDGSKVAFESSADNLLPTDTDTLSDVYVKDLGSGSLTLVSTTAGGVKANGDNSIPRLSSDGTSVSFVSRATNLDPGDTDESEDLYVKDLASGALTLASRTSSGIKADREVNYQAISANGKVVAFDTFATNLDPGDSDVLLDVYVKDLTSGSLTLASKTLAGVKANGFAGTPSLSADGQTLAFDTTATNLDPADADEFSDVYVKNLMTGALTLASTSSAATKGDSDSVLDFSGSALSSDGTMVGFASLAKNLDPLDGDDKLDVYVKNLSTGTLLLASTSGSGVKGNSDSGGLMLSGDGTKAAFTSGATNFNPNISTELGGHYIKDLSSGVLTLVSSNGAGAVSNSFSYLTSLSTDGTYVGLETAGSNLDPADTDLEFDAYVKRVPPSGTIQGIATYPAVVRGNAWHLNTGFDGVADYSFAFGRSTDKPLVGDWDGNGSVTPAVVRGNVWFKSNNVHGNFPTSFAFGSARDFPIAGDWDGDGTFTPGVVRGNTWYLRNSNTTGTADVILSYGKATDTPIVGDWDGNGTSTPGVVRGNTWYLRNSNTTGAADITFSFGKATDTKIAGDWNQDGIVTPGVVRGNTWYLRNSNSTGGGDISFSYGRATDTPIAGSWLFDGVGESCPASTQPDAAREASLPNKAWGNFAVAGC